MRGAKKYIEGYVIKIQELKQEMNRSKDTIALIETRNRETESRFHALEIEKRKLENEMNLHEMVCKKRISECESDMKALYIIIEENKRKVIEAISDNKGDHKVIESFKMEITQREEVIQQLEKEKSTFKIKLNKYQQDMEEKISNLQIYINELTIQIEKLIVLKKSIESDKIISVTEIKTISSL